MRYAVVDLGSNTVRMSVFEENGGNVQHILSEKELLGLVEYTKDGVLSEEGIIRVVNTIGAYRETANAIGADSFGCFATASLRNIKNAQEVTGRVENEAGVVIRIISGEEEARLDFVGAYSASGLSSGLMADMGGGSTELVKFSGGGIVNSVSVPFGSLYLYKKFVGKILPGKNECGNIKQFVKSQFDSIEWLPGCSDTICMIGGTARAIARAHREISGRQRESLQGYSFDAGDIALLYKKIKDMGDKGIRLVMRVAPERIHTIIPGMIAFARIIKTAGCKTAVVTRNGVREGYLREHMIKK